MKKLLLTVTAIIALSVTSFAQSPDAFKYQAVVRDAGNLILNNQAVGMQLTIQQGSVGGTAVYTETFATTTNQYGLVNIEIGTGTTSDDFSLIDWSAGPYFIETAVDITGGTSYVVMGTSQLVSVPYALHATTADSALNDLVDDEDADTTNELNTGLLLNGTDLELTDAGGTITADLSSLSSAGGNWNTNGTDIYNTNTGNVGVGTDTPAHLLEVGSIDTNAVIGLGHIGGFNQVNSGELWFSEDLDFGGGLCGLKFQHNGSANDLYLIGACTSPDTIVRFNRDGPTNIQSLRVGNNITTSPGSASLTIDGDVQVNGSVNITGNISKGGGTFKIDHPLDPENKYLVHSFVESPEMINIFSGNVTTDANGYATVKMPDYFEAANKEFRYQLTVIGTFAQAIIKEKISGNQFVIQTNQPNVEVSWSVTGVRADRYAEENRVDPEEKKELKGTYIHPELYGQGEEKSEQYVQSQMFEANSQDADK